MLKTYNYFKAKCTTDKPKKRSHESLQAAREHDLMWAALWTLFHRSNHFSTLVTADIAYLTETSTPPAHTVWWPSRSLYDWCYASSYAKNQGHLEKKESGINGHSGHLPQHGERTLTTQYEKQASTISLYKTHQQYAVQLQDTAEIWQLYLKLLELCVYSSNRMIYLYISTFGHYYIMHSFILHGSSHFISSSTTKLRCEFLLLYSLYSQLISIIGIYSRYSTC